MKRIFLSKENKNEKKDFKKFEKIINIFIIIILFYLFLLSIELLGFSFKNIGFDIAKNLINNSSTSIFLGLLIGILATAIMQSSSATTSIIIGLFTSSILIGDLEKMIFFIIPYIIGANIGTSITSLLVSFGHIKDKIEFRNAFSISTIHSLFNIIITLIIFPLQYYTNFLGKLSLYLSSFFFDKSSPIPFSNPFEKLFDIPIQFLEFMLSKQNLIDVYLLLILFSFVLIFFSLKYISIFLKQLFLEDIKKVFETIIFRNKYLALFFGFLITLIIQSSSASTALLVPFAAIGLIKLNRAYPFILGSNIGTTITAFIVALNIGTHLALALAFSHILFNLIGIIILYSLPIAREFMYILTEKILTITDKHKYFPFYYIFGIYFLIPLLFIFLFR